MIEVQHLHKSFGSAEVLKNISFSIKKGDIFAVIGESGAGKSSLLRVLARLETPTQGRIFFESQPIETLKKKELANYHRSIGMIFQHFHLLSAKTVFENVAFPLSTESFSKEEKAKIVLELLKFVGLESKKDAYPAELSGGQKQRVAIARALVRKPKLLFCDEATSALDPKSTQEILKLLKRTQSEWNVTIVLITHDMDVVKAISTKVAVIDKGEIVEEAKTEELFFNPKHATTKRLIQTATHEIPKEFFKKDKTLLRLRFKGDAAGKPLISEAIQTFHIEANILLGWIDKLSSGTIGTLVVEFGGKKEMIEKSLEFLKKNDVHFEVLEYGL